MTLPNVISLMRLLSVPAAVWLIMTGRLRPAVWLVLAAAVSDGIDGFIARQFNLRSELGAILDPVADKALLDGTYVSLGATGLLPVWLVALVLARDAAILSGFVVLRSFGKLATIRPLTISKVNTVLQIILAGVTLYAAAYRFETGFAGRALVIGVAASTTLSGIAYLAMLWRVAAGWDHV